MWFYDITDPENPTLEGSYSLPRVPPVDSPEEAERFRCTTHDYSILADEELGPLRGRVSPYYSGGLSVVDFSDPAAPEEKGFYLQQTDGVNPDIWSGYWFRGKIFTNEYSSGYGVGLFKAKGLRQAQGRSRWARRSTRRPRSFPSPGWRQRIAMGPHAHRDRIWHPRSKSLLFKAPEHSQGPEVAPFWRS